MSSYLLSRRALLSLSASLGLTALARGASADPGSAVPATARASRSTSRVTRVSSDARGVTLMMELEHAPFPAPGSWHRDSTVLVFVPHHHRPAPGGAIQLVVHFHGHNSTVERATVAHQLREQLFDSKQNAILVVPELAALAADSSAGKLEAPGAFSRMLDDVLATLETREARAALGSSAPGVRSTPGRVCVSAHSGGYHAAACVVRSGGVKIHEVYLFDALYADTEVFRDWVIAGRGKPMSSRHKLVSYFTAGTTEANTRRLFAELEQAGVTVARETVEGTLSREVITHAEAVSIRTQLTHGTVTSELNSLRDCLYASALRRRLRTSWFDTKQGARPLDRRRR
ncbi:MAG: hypothetical protein KIS78_32790 [Labilithrix sp.]|nr:hypothetical protein [Labilithrix sp.]MCW5837218.1 hypothetical protein [Labilithrix sp.]